MRFNTLNRLLTSLILAAAVTAAAQAADKSPSSELTLYRSDDAGLFNGSASGNSSAGYAMVREPRSLTLTSGLQDISLAGLPRAIDSETLALSFDNDDARVISQRLQLAQGANAMLDSLIGEPVQVINSSGQNIASGTLLAAGENLLVRNADGSSSVIHDYAAVRATGPREAGVGARLDLRLQAKRAGAIKAHLSYATHGLGWRASYVGTLQPGSACTLKLQSRASVANRSGRDWSDTVLTLIAGSPNVDQASGPRPMMLKAMVARSADSLPQQSRLDEYRSYRLPDPVNLPDQSVSLLPLYATRTVDCTRTALYENGNRYNPARPMIDPGFSSGGDESITSTLSLKAFDSFPAGTLRVLSNDARGVPQFIGEDRIDDTPKGGEVKVTLGTAFDLRASRTRTGFTVDKAGHTMDEAFRISLDNASDVVRVVTVREHPNRWRQWTLVSSSSQPSKKGTDTLEFQVKVPAGGKAALNYAVHYAWTAQDEAQ